MNANVDFNRNAINLQHQKIWSAIDLLAEKNGLSVSGLAKISGLDPTALNKCKRFQPEKRGGQPRWPSMESVVKILHSTNTSFLDFAILTEPSNNPLSPPNLKQPIQTCC